MEIPYPAPREQDSYQIQSTNPGKRVHRLGL